MNSFVSTPERREIVLAKYRSRSNVRAGSGPGPVAVGVVAETINDLVSGGIGSASATAIADCIEAAGDLPLFAPAQKLSGLRKQVLDIVQGKFGLAPVSDTDKRQGFRLIEIDDAWLVKKGFDPTQCRRPGAKPQPAARTGKGKPRKAMTGR